MKVRKLAVALAMAGGLGSGVAQALGLGEIELQSYLNEPLNAEINLRKSEGVSPGDVFVNIAPQSAYERVGIDRNFFLTKLNFQVTTAPDGSLLVNVSSREPLREPYLNFLLEVTWPNGRLMREYAILVDPPVYAEESGVEEQVSAPTTSQVQPRQQARQTAPSRSSGTTSQGRSAGSRTLGPTNSADTLWTIAAQVRPNNNLTMQQVMLAIQDLNPDAFIDGNINRLKRGEILRIPDENQIRSRSRAEDNQEVAAQNRALATPPERTVDATGDAADPAANEAAGSSGGDQLRLMAADDTEVPDAADSGSAGGDGDTAGGADAGSAVAMEQLESARRENDELTGRVDDLQDQVETLQRLLELKNTQLAEMQDGQAETPEADTMAAGGGAEAGASESGDAAEQQGMAAEDSTSEMLEEDVSAGGDMEAAAAASDEGVENGAVSSDEEMSDDQSPAAGDTGDDDAAADQPEPAASMEQDSEAEVVPASTGPEPAPEQKAFPGNIIDAISNNFIYQVALGGGLVVLLLLLLLLARRNANREKAFYDELNSETGGDETDSFDLSFDEDEEAMVPEGDAIAEADAYIAYGRNDEAIHTLETAISREPSRTDLRLKLLGVYADTQDRESFDKQFREIEALDDEIATAEAHSLQARLEEAESMPSIDDLESQLRSGGSDQEETSSYDSGYDIEPYGEPDATESAPAAPEGKDAEPDFEDLDLDLPEADDEHPETTATESADTTEAAADDRDDLIEYDVSGLESEEAASELEELEEVDEPEEQDESFDYTLEEGDLEESDLEEGDLEDDDDLSLEFDSSELEIDDNADSVTDSKDTEATVSADESESETDELDVDGDGELDESFLDELDAELDKVAREDDASKDSDGSELDDLELDVSDEDLALMEEFSDSDKANLSDSTESADDDLSLDDELGLEDTLKDEDESDSDSALPPVASSTSPAGHSDREIDESDLGDDDDFDFLAGTDEAATKLDLARAYVEMGDVDGARDILEEVALEGDDAQKAEAQDLLKNLS